MPDETIVSTTSALGQEPAASPQPNPTERYTALYGTSTTQEQPDPLVALTAQVEALKAQLAAQPAPTATPTPTASTDDWLEALAKGDKAKGEQALANKVDELVGNRRVQEALALFQMHQQVDAYTNKLRTENPELGQMESYITASVQAKLNAAQAAGKVKTPADYVTVYKDILSKEVDDARKLILTFRGEGAQNATTRTQQVTAATPLRPNTFSQQVQGQQPQTEQVESASDYLAKRQESMLRQRNMIA